VNAIIQQKHALRQATRGEEVCVRTGTGRAECGREREEWCLGVGFALAIDVGPQALHVHHRYFGLIVFTEDRQLNGTCHEWIIKINII
jgi:hypothetical protein